MDSAKKQTSRFKGSLSGEFTTTKRFTTTKSLAYFIGNNSNHGWSISNIFIQSDCVES